MPPRGHPPGGHPPVGIPRQPCPPRLLPISISQVGAPPRTPPAGRTQRCAPPGGHPPWAHPRVGFPSVGASPQVAPFWVPHNHLSPASPRRGDPSAPNHHNLFFLRGGKGGDQRQSWGRAEKGSAAAAPAPCLSLPLSPPHSPQVNVPAIIFIYSRDAARMLLLIVFYQGDSFSLLKQAARKNIPIWGEG